MLPLHHQTSLERLPQGLWLSDETCLQQRFPSPSTAIGHARDPLWMFDLLPPSVLFLVHSVMQDR